VNQVLHVGDFLLALAVYLSGLSVRVFTVKLRRRTTVGSYQHRCEYPSLFHAFIIFHKLAKYIYKRNKNVKERR
jgi:hypothetical protein